MNGKFEQLSIVYKTSRRSARKTPAVNTATVLIPSEVLNANATRDSPSSSTTRTFARTLTNVRKIMAAVIISAKIPRAVTCALAKLGTSLHAMAGIASISMNVPRGRMNAIIMGIARTLRATTNALAREDTSFSPIKEHVRT